MKPGFALSIVSALSFLAACAAPAQSSKPQFALGGTSWQLVAFHGPGGANRVPADRSLYRFEFKTDGTVSVLFDCNRGRGSWKSPSVGKLELGPLALTRAMCPPESMHDQLAADWGHIRSFSFINGALFLQLDADGGNYELELTQP